MLPGFIDAHAHVGVHEEGEGWAGNDTNEMTDPVMAQVRAIDAINPYDLGFRDAITGGVLAVNVNPGSGNPIGGQTAALKCWGRSVDEMVLRQPSGLKSALGENPKRVWGEQRKTPGTRLGTAAVIRAAFVDAANYLARLELERGKPAEPTASTSTVTSSSKRSAWCSSARSRGGSTAPRRRHRDRDADRRGVRLRAGDRSWHRSAPAGRRASPPRASRSLSGRCSPAGPRSN